MSRPEFIYAPALPEDFRCRVPLRETRQLYVVNGTVQGAGAPLSIRMDEGQAMDKMLQIIAIRNDDGPEALAFEENFNFAENSSGKILHCSHTFSPTEFSTEEKINITLGKGASLEFTVMQHEHSRAAHDTLFSINLAEGAALNLVVITLNGGKVNNRLKASLNGRKADCRLAGLYLTGGSQKADTSVELIHQVPECSSNQLFKGILDQEGKASFYGLIRVVPDAQKTEAYQANHNLLLSETARATTQPQLEIYADDVKCSHGATVGKLREDELFYMRTRGIPDSEARILQQMAFAYEVLERIYSPELRDRLLSLVEKRLRGTL